MHLTLHLTTACNMACDYCYSPPSGRASMSAATALRALAFGSELAGSAGSCGVIFFGGEPLLKRDLIREVVARAREEEQTSGIRRHFKITTNGLLLDEPFLVFSEQCGMQIAMSFDGVREAHDAHRRLGNGKGSFDLLLEKLRMLLAAKPYSMIISVVNPDTARYLADSVAFLNELGVRYHVISLNYAASWGKSDFRLLEKQYRKLAALYLKWTEAGKKFYLSPLEVKISSHINGHCFRKERCELAERQISVDPEGNLFPCVQFTRAGRESRWCIGSLESGIDPVARRTVHDESEADKEQCRHCALKNRCLNTCGCLNWQATGSINRVSPVLCKNERILMPIADRLGEKLFEKRNPEFIHKHYNAAYPFLSLLEDRASGP